MFFVVLGAVVLGVSLLLWFAHRTGAVLKTTLITVALATVIWLLDWAWINSDPTGAGGAFDCWPDCSFAQEVAQIGFLSPHLYVVTLVIGLAVRAAITFVPRQRGQAGGHRSPRSGLRR